MLKKIFLICSFVFALLAVSQAVAEASDELDAPDIARQVTDVISDMDEDWPIVRIERTEQFDSETETRYVTVLIVRQLLSSSTTSSTDVACVETLSPSACYKQGVATFYQTDTRSSGSGWITSHVKHWTDVTCNGTDCIYLKPTKLEAWWTRSGSNWRITGAYAGWGCVGCARCGGGDWTTVWIENPSYTPAWQNNTNSFVYVYTSTSYPGLYPYDSTTDRASMDSDAYEGWTYRGHMRVNPGFG